MVVDIGAAGTAGGGSGGNSIVKVGDGSKLWITVGGGGGGGPTSGLMEVLVIWRHRR